MKVKATEKQITYGGFFGKTLVTAEVYMDRWQDEISQLIRLVESDKDIDTVQGIQEELRKIAVVNSRKLITEQEANTRGIPLKI